MKHYIRFLLFWLDFFFKKLFVTRMTNRTSLKKMTVVLDC